MAETKTKRTKGCLIGCGVLILLALLVLVVQYLGIRWAANRAIESRAEIEELYGDQTQFTPAPDGTIPAERMTRFLAVREQLFPFCEPLTAVQEPFARIALLEEMEEDEIPARQTFSDVFSAIGGSFKLGRLLGNFEITRNESLLENEMGLGEYTWIYVISYYSWLGNQPLKFAVASEDYPKIYRDRVTPDLHAMIRRHVEHLERVVDETDQTVNPEVREQLALWNTELNALLSDAERIPFQDGLPPSLSASLEPFGNQLESLFCPSATELEYMHTQFDGFAFEHN